MRILTSFAAFGSWTEQGIKKVKEAPERIKQSHSMIEKAGGKSSMELVDGAGKDVLTWFADCFVVY